jgi:hypothetical protein
MIREQRFSAGGVMTSRREFLQIGITATAWPLAPAAVRAAGEITSLPLPLHKVIFDRRFAASIEFGEHAESLGLAVHGIDGDMTRFWYDELYHEWKKGPAAIAGLTTHGPMFCFEQLARDQGMRIVFRAEHRPGVTGVEHTLTGPLPLRGESMALDDCGQRWPQHMADVITHCARGRAEISSAATVSAGARLALAPGTESLYSWIIAAALGG